MRGSEIVLTVIPMTSASGHETDKKTDPERGPFSDTTTTTYELTGLKLTVQTKYESSHVPPPKDCGCGGAKLDVPGIDSPLGVFLGEFGKKILEMLYRIQA